MIIGPRITRRFGWRWRRISAAERAGGRLAAKIPDVGAWRRPPPAGTGARLGHARAVIAANSSAPAPDAPPPDAVEAAPPEQSPLAVLDPGPERAWPSLAQDLGPACEALSSTAFAANAGGRDRLILVTSPAAGEGKSFMAISLALALARSGQPVLLVDGDAHTAGAARAFGWPPAPGLSEALAGELPLDEAIRPTGLDTLSFLPPGLPRATLPELLAGRRLPEVMRALLARQSSGLVVIDGPPLLTGVAAAALAGCAGQVILLVTAGRTSQQAIRGSLAWLGERDGVRCIFARPAPLTCGAARQTSEPA